MIVEVSPNSIELAKICSLFTPYKAMKINAPASLGPNPPIEIGKIPKRKIPGTTNRMYKILISIPTECRQTQKANPKKS